MTARVGCEGDGIAEGDYEPHATTLDYVVAAAVACLTGTLGGMLASTGQPLDDGELVADNEADLVKEAGTIWTSAIRVHYRLRVSSAVGRGAFAALTNGMWTSLAPI